MSAAKYSEEFKQQVVSGGRWETPARPAEVAKSYGLVPQTVRMLGEQVEEKLFRHRG